MHEQSSAIRDGDSEDAIEFVISQYTREAGVRLLEQKLAAVIRFGAARVAKEEITSFHIDKETVEKALGAPNSVRESANATPRIGVVNGLAYTPIGGEVLSIEAVKYEGSLLCTSPHKRLKAWSRAELPS